LQPALVVGWVRADTVAVENERLRRDKRTSAMASMGSEAAACRNSPTPFHFRFSWNLYVKEWNFVAINRDFDITLDAGVATKLSK
jgi:hypothetical protein